MSSPLLVATKNPGKLKELNAILGQRFALISAHLPDVAETGATYDDNALLKAEAGFRLFGKPTLADDSGLEVDLLGGRPGIHSARYGGAEISWPERWQKLADEMSAAPESEWHARFRCVLCYYDGGTPFFFEGVAHGRIVKTAAGAGGFGYDPIFLSAALKKTFAEASFEEKQRVSHRALALKSFLDWWEASRLA